KRAAYVRCGSAADKTSSGNPVRFTPESGQTADMPVCPLSAKSGLTHCNTDPRYLITSFAWPILFNNLGRGGEQRCRDVQAEQLGGFEVDDQLVLGRCLNWKIARLLPP